MFGAGVVLDDAVEIVGTRDVEEEAEEVVDAAVSRLGRSGRVALCHS